MLLKRMKSFLTDQEQQRNAILLTLDVIDKPVELFDEKLVARVVADILSGDIDVEELEDKLDECNNKINAITDCIAAAKAGDKFDEMHIGFLKSEFLL